MIALVGDDVQRHVAAGATITLGENGSVIVAEPADSLALSCVWNASHFRLLRCAESPLPPKLLDEVGEVALHTGHSGAAIPSALRTPGLWHRGRTWQTWPGSHRWQSTAVRRWRRSSSDGTATWIPRREHRLNSQPECRQLWLTFTACHMGGHGSMGIPSSSAFRTTSPDWGDGYEVCIGAKHRAALRPLRELDPAVHFAHRFRSFAPR